MEKVSSFRLLAANTTEIQSEISNVRSFCFRMNIKTTKMPRPKVCVIFVDNNSDLYINASELPFVLGIDASKGKK